MNAAVRDELPAALFIALIAGGGGTRLWPKSRRQLPKQLMPLTGSRSLLQMTAERALPLCGSQRLYVVTARDLVEAVRAQLPEVPAAQVIGEPVPRNTAMAIGLAAAYIARQDPQAIMASLGSDHLIRDVESFRRCLVLAARAAADGRHLVTIGVEVTSPHTGYGYIERGEPMLLNGATLYRVRSFKEKPDLALATRYWQSGTYYWNTNYFVWRVDALFRAFATHAPALSTALERIRAALGTDAEHTVIEEVFHQAPSAPIDTAIMEKADNLLVVPGSFDWVDIGAWGDMHVVAQQDGPNYILAPEQTATLLLDSAGCLVHGFTAKRLIAGVGLQDLVIVDTPDALLVLPRHRAQEVREIVNRLTELGRTDLL